MIVYLVLSVLGAAIGASLLAPLSWLQSLQGLVWLGHLDDRHDGAFR